MNRPKGLLLLIGVGLLVFFITREAYRPTAPTERVSGTVLLERIRPVLKLVTVEGDFNELYTYHDAQAYFDWLKSFPPFQKKAVLRVKARVSVGYNLDGLNIQVNEGTKTIRLTGMPAPQVLSMEHEIDYFDMEAGTFNPFTAQDHTRMEAEAKQIIRAKIPESGLLRAAADRKQEVIAVVQTLAESAGWSFEYGRGAATPVKN